MSRPALTISAALLFAMAPGLVAGANSAAPAAGPAAGANPAASAPAVQRSTSANAAQRPTHAPAAQRSTRAPARSTAKHPATAPANAAPRTLSDVHIEGEIPVPQVLFITSRDPRRFTDFQHHHYLARSNRLAEDTPLPAWVAVIHAAPGDSRKETAR